MTTKKTRGQPLPTEASLRDREEKGTYPILEAKARASGFEEARDWRQLAEDSGRSLAEIATEGMRGAVRWYSAGEQRRLDRREWRPPGAQRSEAVLAALAEISTRAALETTQKTLLERVGHVEALTKFVVEAIQSRLETLPMEVSPELHLQAERGKREFAQLSEDDPFFGLALGVFEVAFDGVDIRAHLAARKKFVAAWNTLEPNDTLELLVTLDTIEFAVSNDFLPIRERINNEMLRMHREWARRSPGIPVSARAIPEAFLRTGRFRYLRMSRALNGEPAISFSIFPEPSVPQRRVRTALPMKKNDIRSLGGVSYFTMRGRQIPSPGVTSEVAKLSDNVLTSAVLEGTPDR